MQRRAFIQGLLAAGAISCAPRWLAGAWADSAAGVSVEDLPALKGDLTLYLGRGEGGLYEHILKAISDRNPEFNLKIRRGPTAALANAILAEAKAGIRRADVFWAVDSGAIGMIHDAGLTTPMPADISSQLSPKFRYPGWAPVSGRIRTLAYNPERVSADKLPSSILALADSDLRIAWSPSYASFQSFVTAMRILHGEDATAHWLQKMNRKATKIAGELGVVMAVERGEVDVGLANHYYTLRLKSGKPDAQLALAFTNNDAGCLVNAGGVLALNERDTSQNFMRYLFSREVQSYLAREAYEVPMVAGIEMPPGLPPLTDIVPPEIDLTRLANLRPTLDLLRKTSVL